MSELKLDQNFLDTLDWHDLDVEPSGHEEDQPARVSFSHPLFFMVLNFGPGQGVAFSHDESVALLRHMMSKLPLDALGELPVSDAPTIVTHAPKPFEVYQHSKGTRYLVLGVFTHTETGECMVAYRELGNPEARQWVRPLSMWYEQVSVEDRNYAGPRFVKLNKV